MASVVDTESSFGPLTDPEILDLWTSETDFDKRDRILEELQKRKLFPAKFQDDWEQSSGAYPSLDDPLFIPKLLKHREFAESKQTTWKPSRDICTTTDEFEITPVQRFVANFMSPRSPYMSMLLYHGVGVGKTCAAVQIAESWLDTFPRSKVIIVAPPTIQSGFYRTIFDINRVKIGEGDEPNTAIQCTGDSYLGFAGVTLEREKDKIQRRINKIIDRRYTIYGYIQFANLIRDLLKRIPPGTTDEKRTEMEYKILNQEFSGRLLIIDEVHNLRDVGIVPELGEDEDEKGEIGDELRERGANSEVESGGRGADAPAGGVLEKTAAEQGKRLTPFIKKLLTNVEGMKLTCLTATPMYNTYREIIFLFNLLLMNDKKATLIETDIFNRDGTFRLGGEERLGKVAQRYVSFMRGENPASFPLRLYPLDIPRMTREEYPAINPRGTVVPDEEMEFVRRLPIVPIQLKGDAFGATMDAIQNLPQSLGGLNYLQVESLVAAGSFVMPVPSGRDVTFRDRCAALAWRLHFNRTNAGSEARFTPLSSEPGAVRWLSQDQIGNYSPKYEFFLRRAQQAEGVVFAYTRYVNNGALPLALVLEANGYTPYGRKTKLLNAGIQSPGGRQCALCSSRETAHRDVQQDHEFVPAHYIIVTGDEELGGKNATNISSERDPKNVDGRIIKVIIGSQVAAEGVDFKFIREEHILDSWYHLNRMEQIIGRGIRFCSHSALPPEKRNTTIYMYASVLPPGAMTQNRETGDLYSYRVAYRKAVEVGRVSRIMKQYAVDCNLNHDAILIRDTSTVDIIDGQRERRAGVPIRDMDYTAVCDWIECDYKCIPEVGVNLAETTDSTYDEFAAKWKINELKKRIRKLFALQTFYRREDFLNFFNDVPGVAYVNLLKEVVDNKNFSVTSKNGQEGYVKYCNTYYIFQPYSISDIRIPLAIRSAKFPIKRDDYVGKIIPRLGTTAVDRAPLSMATAVGATGVGATGVVTSASAPTALSTITEIRELYNYNEPWKLLQEWIHNVVDDSHDKVPDNPEFGKWVLHVSNGNTQLIDRCNKVLGHTIEFVKYWRTAGGKNPGALKDALMDLYFDSWMTFEEQIDAGFKHPEWARERFGSCYRRFGSIDVYITTDPRNGAILYFCDERPCAKSVVDTIKADKDSKLGKRSAIYREISGPLYGFMSPKRGQMVFKTDVPPPNKGDKVGRGSECAIVSTMKAHLDKIDMLIGLMNAAGGLGRWNARLRDDIKGSIKACTIIEIMLRYLEKVSLNGKIWFYNSVEALMAGHKGTY
jgi:hypothetical protein